ncbi:exported hypothetical protein [[Clostridium] ultunense Esp]|uniref:X-X-X-Leu-X-X-Gly heptad repeat-containing protein n=1 Tax=[Clostridium] ultunense Esp TaxID=1288971 RepID=M1Z5B1_9FIRM|nr:hypothetical protein [Schnuerera ultunensis]CCQ92959.1 exported hypothetical protein [[Clostridium] ultunense Esp]SHD78435.1 conserved exported protein of unknown function [[Clostridium] ultunense Esp]
MKRFLSFLMIFTMIFSFSTLGLAEIDRNETIYVNLNHDGTTKNIKVVNHISGNSKEEYYTDYGQYEDLKVLVDGVDPIIEDHTIKWPTVFLGNRDIYYEGSLNKDLPMTIDIDYFLDGKEIEGEELAGKSGNLKINISIKNSTDLTTQFQIPLNLDIFSNIKVGNGVNSVIGKTMTVVFTHLPIENQEFSIEAKGENIELDPILIASTPSNIPLPKNLGEDIGSFSEGINKMSKAARELEEGSFELTKGTISLKEGLKTLSSGIGKFYSGFNEISTNSQILTKGLLDFNNGFKLLTDNILGLWNGINNLNHGFNEIKTETQNIQEGISSFNQGTKEVNKGFEQLKDGLNELNSNHKDLVTLAESLSSSNDPRVRALAEGVIKEGIAIDALSQGANNSFNGLIILGEKVNELDLGFQEYNKGINTIGYGLNELIQQLKPLPEELENMYKGHSQLTEGINSIFNGFEPMTRSFEELNNKTKSLPNKVDKLIDGQNNITKGISTLNDEGLLKIKNSIDGFSILDESDNKYTSFVHDKNENNTTFQFIMQTPAIKLVPERKEIELRVEGKKSFFERFLSLFRK